MECTETTQQERETREASAFLSSSTLRFPTAAARESAVSVDGTKKKPSKIHTFILLCLLSLSLKKKKKKNCQVFTATTVRKDDTVENALKAAYKTGRVGLAATLGAGGALSATASVADVAPGLAVSLTGALPDIAAAKLGLDYLRPHLTAKATVGLSATPKVELSATSGVRDVAFGVSGAYDAAKGAVSAWSAGASLTRPDFQASAVLLDLGKTVKLGYAHNVDAATVAGAEVTRALDGGAETVFAVRKKFFFIPRPPPPKKKTTTLSLTLSSRFPLSPTNKKNLKKTLFRLATARGSRRARSPRSAPKARASPRCCTSRSCRRCRASRCARSSTRPTWTSRPRWASTSRSRTKRRGSEFSFFERREMKRE